MTKIYALLSADNYFYLAEALSSLDTTNVFSYSTGVTVAFLARWEIEVTICTERTFAASKVALAGTLTRIDVTNSVGCTSTDVVTVAGLAPDDGVITECTNFATVTIFPNHSWWTHAFSSEIVAVRTVAC